MATASNRLAIGQSLVQLLQGVTNPNTASALYGYVKQGHLYDPSPYAAWAEVTIASGKSGPAGSGGSLVGWRIEDKATYLITSGAAYDPSSSAGEVAILTMMDVLLPLLHSHPVLPNPSNQSVQLPGVYSFLLEQADQTRIAKFPNGRIYLLWHVRGTVAQQYNVTLTIP